MTIMDENFICRLCMKNCMKKGTIIFDDESENEVIHLLKAFQLNITPDPCKSNMICMECCLKLENFKKFQEACIENEKLWNKLKKVEVKVKDVSDEDNHTGDAVIANQISDAGDNESVVSVVTISNNCKKEQIPFECDLCDKKYQSKPGLTYHMRVKHMSITCPNRKYTCEPCGKRFSCLSILRRHMFRHLTDATKQSLRIYKCAVCKATYTRKYSLRYHIKFDHLKQGVVCADCGKLCGSKENLKSHRRYVHGEKTTNLQCPTCKQWYASRMTLRVHIKSQHTKSETFSCHFCGKKFFNKQNLLNHIKTNHMERAFKCDYCSKSFVSEKLLKEHTAKHTGIALYRCPYCSNKRFNCKSSMFKHFKDMHPKEYEKDKSKRGPYSTFSSKYKNI